MLAALHDADQNKLGSSYSSNGCGRAYSVVCLPGQGRMSSSRQPITLPDCSLCMKAWLLQVSDKLPSKAEPAYQYSEVLHKSFLFYFQQRSGKLPHQVRAPSN